MPISQVLSALHNTNPKEKMVISNTLPTYNRAQELKAFDDTKTGVKGLLDSGIAKLPRIFIRPSDEINQNSSSGTSIFQIPFIDLQGRHEEVVQGIKSASEKWGFFQIANHGVPLSVLDEMVKGAIRFNEEDDNVKKQYYSRDRTRRVRYNSNHDLYESKGANWRDTLAVVMLKSDPLDPDQLPVTNRDATVEYTKHIGILGDKLYEVLSEALGLNPDHLKQMNFDETCTCVSHYYPGCPEPELTLGATSHTDFSVITILHQNNIGGLQVLHQDHWVDVHPIPGALVVNIGDLLQVISNDKFKSVEHRVLANYTGPRVSVPCFLSPHPNLTTRLYGPIKELIPQGSSPVYREFTYKEYLDHFYLQGFDGSRGLHSFRM